MFSEILSYLTNTAASQNSFVALLLLIVSALIFAVVFIVSRYEKSHERFIEYLRESKEDMKSQLAQCEERCRDNSDEFFKTINMLVAQIKK